MDAGSLPIWAQQAATVAIAIVAAITGVFSYLKKSAAEKPPVQSAQASVVSASFIESKLLKELIEALREHQEEMGRDIKRLVRVAQDMREVTEANTEAVIHQTDAANNISKLINKSKTRGVYDEINESR